MNSRKIPNINGLSSIEFLDGTESNSKSRRAAVPVIAIASVTTGARSLSSLARPRVGIE
jgi:hypothetical protein